MVKASVAFLTTYPEAEIRSLLEIAPPQLNVFHVDNRLPVAEKRACLQDTRFIILLPADISVELVQSCKRLQLLQLFSSGYDRIDLKRISEIGVPVANNGGSNAIAVAEFTIALMLNVMRHFARLLSTEDQRAWKSSIWKQSHDLEGKTVGIIGLGSIGENVAARLRGFGVRLIGSQSDGHIPRFNVEELGIQMVPFDRILEESDIISLHVPLNPETHNLIGKMELAKMKKNAILINTSRGEVIDEDALYDALKRKRIAGAALDVIRQEPVPDDHPLRQLDNVIITPHTASLTMDSRLRVASFAYENIMRVLNGKEPLNQIKAN